MKRDLLFKRFEEIKRKKKLLYHDVHTNPGDVFAVAGENQQTRGEGAMLPGPTILERLDYSPIALHILGFLFYYFPNYMEKQILAIYETVSEDSFLNTFDKTHIDFAVSLPALSDPEPLRIHSIFTNKRFIPLGTIDVHSIDIEMIEREVIRQKKIYGIVGLKFNPNIQRFFPEPSRNIESISKKLVEIYKVAEKNRLFLLIHGGVSYTPDLVQRDLFKRVTYGELQNFFQKKEETGYLFSAFSGKLIIAHLGHYNSFKIRYDLLKKITTKFDQVYFDTCGISTAILKKFIKEFGVSRIIFGSDMPYFNVRFSIISLLKTLNELYTNEDFEESVAQVFSTNFADKILRRWNM